MQDDAQDLVGELLRILRDVGMADVELACRNALLELESAEFRGTDDNIGSRVTGRTYSEGDQLSVVIATIRAQVELPILSWHAGVELLRSAKVTDRVQIESDRTSPSDERSSFDAEQQDAEALGRALRELWQAAQSPLQAVRGPFEMDDEQV